MSTRQYPTGADVTAYMGEDRVIGSSVSAAGVTLPISAATRLQSNYRELDVAHVTVVEDGQAAPLYDFTDKMAGEFMYSRSMVNLELQFNYSQGFAQRHRLPTIQQIRGKTMWLLMEKAQWWPEPAVVRDLVRIDEVHEHSFRHEPNPSASEQVPCTARELTLVGRREQAVDTGPIASSIQQDGTPKLPDAFKDDRSRYIGNVTEVVDGDTLKVQMEATGEVVDVRLVGVDTPESPGSPRLNQNDWNWPNKKGSASRGTYGESPSEDQLYEWGSYATERAKEELEGENVWLVADPGAAPVDDPEFEPDLPKDEEGRLLFQVKPTVPLDLQNGKTERDYGTWLLKRGLARHVPTTSIGAGHENRADDLREVYRRARDKTGTSGAKGIWYAFDKDTWDAQNNLTP